MREAEFIHLLGKVEAALNPAVFDDFVQLYAPATPPKAANDNEEPWDHEPFPDGWIASS